MEFRLGSFIFNERQSANCNVDSLVVIERPRIQNYEPIIRSRPGGTTKLSALLLVAASTGPAAKNIQR